MANTWLLLPSSWVPWRRWRFVWTLVTAAHTPQKWWREEGPPPPVPRSLQPGRRKRPGLLGRALAPLDRLLIRWLACGNHPCSAPLGSKLVLSNRRVAVQLRLAADGFDWSMKDPLDAADAGLGGNEQGPHSASGWVSLHQYHSSPKGRSRFRAIRNCADWGSRPFPGRVVRCRRLAHALLQIHPPPTDAVGSGPYIFRSYWTNLWPVFRQFAEAYLTVVVAVALAWGNRRRSDPIVTTETAAEATTGAKSGYCHVRETGGKLHWHPNHGYIGRLANSVLTARHSFLAAAFTSTGLLSYRQGQGVDDSHHDVAGRLSGTASRAPHVPCPAYAERQHPRQSTGDGVILSSCTPCAGRTCCLTLLVVAVAVSQPYRGPYAR